ncbi:hypothetical protein GA0070216_102103 [Micromonospora matsumotoense]|uniref:Uncharacterized protein n=1 Tax=Micromonospora matsumotoense TaxID=121616 RepID=A0A1C4V3V1_9ACTN|nr:hypothetical protein [Micromonospora matsumotoense]SCE78652.1 hypothetical protein GA0070216_102103 [Micromonospora matsumotoense]
MTDVMSRAAGRHRPLLVLSMAAAVLAVVTAVGVVVDGRVLTGVPIWLKPFKFSVSFVLYGATLAWMLAQLPRRSRVAEWSAGVVVAVALVEMLVIVGQVLRGTTSHYNETSALNAALWQVMGMAIMVLFVAHVVVAVVLLVRRARDRATTWAVGLGLGLSALGMLVAFPMVRPDRAGAEGIAGAHSVGVPDGGPGLPILGWSTTGGDLRIGHFVGLHAMQALPILAFLLRRYLDRWLDERSRVGLLVVAGAGYGVLTVLLTWQALRGQPLLRPDLTTLTALAALAAATTVAVVAVVARRRRPELVLAA